MQDRYQRVEEEDISILNSELELQVVTLIVIVPTGNYAFLLCMTVYDGEVAYYILLSNHT
jgi:hypothetical protein